METAGQDLPPGSIRAILSSVGLSADSPEPGNLRPVGIVFLISGVIALTAGMALEAGNGSRLSVNRAAAASADGNGPRLLGVSAGPTDDGAFALGALFSF